jgi:hypothetical protein
MLAYIDAVSGRKETSADLPSAAEVLPRPDAGKVMTSLRIVNCLPSFRVCRAGP